MARVVMAELTEEARCRRGALIGAIATSIPARATRLNTRPDKAASLILVPNDQMLWRSDTCVPGFMDFTHQATVTPSLKAYRNNMLAMVEAMARRTAGWTTQWAG